MKRTLPALRLPRTPLVYVIAQVKISPIVNIGKYLPELQEQVRVKGFPRFKRGLVHEVVLDAQGPRVLSSDRFEFINKQETINITVSSDFIAVQTCKYESFDEFEKSIVFALKTVLNVVKSIGLAERIGLRYIDWLRPEDGDVFSLLKPGLHGLETKTIGLKQTLRRTEVSGQTEYGQFIARFYQQLGQLLPPEIGHTNLAQPAVAPGQLVSLLDFDHFTQDAIDFDLDSVIETMGNLHDNLDIAFRNSVSTEAIEKWSKSNG